VTDAGQHGGLRLMSEGSARYVPYRRPAPGAPNVAIIVLDDIGFAQLGCFGAAIATPNIDRLAAAVGLRYEPVRRSGRASPALPSYLVPD
jgi:Sulfatase